MQDDLHSSTGTDAPAKGVVRPAIAALALVAGYFAATASTPAKLPAIALQQELVYRGVLFLVVLYGGLLIATPLLRGLLSGLLPTEITARGARYDREQVSGGLRETEARIDQLKELVETSNGHVVSLTVDLADARQRVEQLEQRA